MFCSDKANHELLRAAGHSFCWKCGLGITDAAKMIARMRKMSWEDFWLGFLAIILTTAAIFLSTWLLKDKHVDGYYLSSKFASSDKPDETCVEAHWTWHTDEHVFCTTDTEKALDFLNKANASMKK